MRTLMNRIPLGLIESGSSATVREIKGSALLKHQFLEQGLVDGCRVQVVRNDTGGPLIISIKDTRLAIGRGASLQILVESVAGVKYFASS
jgi:Fe2+ transport system protein FeoA